MGGSCVTRVQKYRKVAAKRQNEPKQQLTPPEALSMFVEAGLSRKQYEIIRTFNKNNYYPRYSILQTAKKTCYPLEI